MGRLQSKEVYSVSSKVETNYRSSPKFLSYSKLSKFASDKQAFYKKYILQEVEDEEDKKELQIGSLVDILITEPENFSEKIEIAPETLPPPQMRQFCKFVIQFCKTELTDLGLKLAYDKLKEWNGGTLQTGFDTYVTNFSKPIVQTYFQMLQSDKLIISSGELNLAQNIISSIEKSKRFLPRDVNNEVIRKLVINFTYQDVLFGAEIDELEIDHTKKIIHLYDYKCCNFIENFLWNNFLKFKYYIQASLYHYGLQQWADINLPGYVVQPMTFKVSDSANYLEPLIYETSEKQISLGFSGFYVGNTYYKGIDELIEEYKISVEKDLWRISVINYNNGGVIKIPEFTSPLEKNG